MILKMLSRLRRDKKGQSLVEYGLLIAGVALVGAGATSLFGHKTSDIIAAVTTILPGAHTDDNAPIVSGHLIDTALNNGTISLDTTTIMSQSNGQTDRLGMSLFGPNNPASGQGLGGLIVESQ